MVCGHLGPGGAAEEFSCKPIEDGEVHGAVDEHAGGDFGAAVAVHGDNIVVGAPWESSDANGVNGNQNNNDRYHSGAAYLFNRSANTWSQPYYLKAAPLYSGSENQFGGRVALTEDFVVVGSVNADEIGSFVDTTPPPPAMPSRIEFITVTPTEVTLECTGQPEANYHLLRKENLEEGWSFIGFGTAQLDGTFTLMDYDPPSDAAFYALQLDQP